MSASRQVRPTIHLNKRPTWVLVLVPFVTIFLIFAYLFSPRSSSEGCFIFSSNGCGSFFQKPLFLPTRDLTDGEIASQAVIKEILRTPNIHSKNPKIAFMFLTPSSLPFEMLWDKFFSGHEERFTVYVHASKESPTHVSPYFVGRDIRSEKVSYIFVCFQVVWGKFSMIEAEKRLLGKALLDPDNEHFVLLSDSCVPVHNFDYVYNYLIFTNVSFVDCFVDPGPHGNGRYSEHMLPEVARQDFRKGSQWFSLKRQHAIIVMADSLYHRKFKLFCRPNMNGRNCYSDEHYLQTFLRMKDPGGIANWSVTHVDWSEGKWHPKAYRAQDISFELLKNITSIDESTHVTSDNQKTIMTRPCIWNGLQRPCYLFARKFYPETLDKLIHLFSNYAGT
ncbi:glycosyltransferase BC10-like [Humulus lupulus]|uniref:glycosyltransferase BC10-like n=1 Tax=Humulus lupulus TaxID=3486 RepID=UPI002B4152F4|nr:glycosyltransferase BC10-like [Humulus lupulus]